MQIGLLGFGKMGRQIAEKLMGDNHEVVVWNRSKEVLDQYRVDKAELITSGKLKIERNIEAFRDSLIKPRVFWVMVPAGEATDNVLEEVKGIVEPGDVVVDGGNSNYKDTERRFADFEKLQVKYLGAGVSGGIHGQENGFSIMAGGNKEGYDYILSILDSLVKPNGSHAYLGTGGAGHFAKMVHNGIEYGMMQALAEGFGLLAKSDYRFNLLDVANVYQKGSIVSGFLLWMVELALSKDPTLAAYDGTINSTGEGKWTVEAAKELHVPAPVIEQSLEFRSRSTYDKLTQQTYVAKLVAAMRTEFGGHAPSVEKPKEEPTKEPQK